MHSAILRLSLFFLDLATLLAYGKGYLKPTCCFQVAFIYLPNG